jgi:hypothetical protein
MSKLEAKLAASIKPKRHPVDTATAAARAKPSTTGSLQPPQTADLNAPAQPLHPRRIWPD